MPERVSIISKYFDELTTKELYEILKARAEIFVVEQNCVYQDLDDVDYRSLHIFCEEDGEVTAYLRAFFKDADTVQVGRVLTRHHGTGLGGHLLKEGISQIRTKMNPAKIYIEAQCYAVGFYERKGFRICSEEFLEDGIPHVQMVLQLNGS
jgi:ElaA protein